MNFNSIKEVKLFLTALKFLQKDENNIFYKIYLDCNKTLSIELNETDIKNSKIKYEEIGVTVTRDTTSNFSEKENFVVLECVDRLLLKGYKPENIELEPHYKVGHGASGGFADIALKDEKGKYYLIIECKTYGKEFNDEFKKMENNGGQLFSYFQQEKNTKWLCLYSSELNLDKIQNKYYLISVEDNKEVLKSKQNFLTYKDANDVLDLFNVWKNTYNLDYSTYGLFENNIELYKIGQSKKTINDLKEISYSDDIFKQYKYILRKYNISSLENAFDKLINLILVKVIDESENQNDLKFYWKGHSFDNRFDLQDRLQKLYQEGMRKFLNEEITYIEDKKIDTAFRYFKQDPKSTKETIKDLFHQLKFFTNNDFSFINVYNEKLFYQNSNILIEVIKMIQDYKFKTDINNQSLGELFENFLNDGVKQSEGQYFTPLPIVRFIVSSLPLKILVNNKEPLKVIDYACGAGHFLTEYGEQIANILKNDNTKDIKEYYKSIIGIEKENRLCKISKVSAFMFNKGEMNIIYGDGLVKNENIKENSFDLIIANPPYSVKGFLETLSKEERKLYELMSNINESQIYTNSSIECFFIERAKQLLKPNGIASIILPASLLTNNGIYINTRKLILKYFKIIAIAEFGSGTFGKTGTPTITLFLKRKDFPPEEYEFIEDRINSNFEDDEEFEDKQILEEYYKLIDENKQQNKERLLYFYLSKQQKEPIIIIKSPTNNNELKQFLGYEWTNRNKNYRIKYLNSNINDNEDNEYISDYSCIDNLQTLLFNPKNLDDETKINNLIKKNFNNEPITIPDELKDFVYITKLTNIIDFNKNIFDLQFDISKKEKIEIKSKYENKKISELLKYEGKGKRPAKFSNENGKIDFIISSFKRKKCNIADFEGEYLIIGDGGSANINYVNGKFSSSDHTYIFSKNETNFLLKYIYYFLYFNINILQLGFDGIGIQNISKSYIEDIYLPLPPLNIQQEIIKEIETIENKEKSIEREIEENNKEIFELIENCEDKKEYSLNDFSNDCYAGGDAPKEYSFKKTIEYSIPIFSNGIENKGLYGYTNKIRCKEPAITISARGTIGHLEIRNEPFFPIVRLIVLIPNQKIVNIKILYYLLNKIKFNQTGSTISQLTVPNIQNIKLNIPSIKIQEKILKQIEEIEKQQEQFKKDLENCKQEKKNVLNSYLFDNNKKNNDAK